MMTVSRRCLSLAVALLPLAACNPVAEPVRPEAPAKTESCSETVNQPDPVEIQTPCPDLLTQGLVASLQRALKVRGLYDGAVDGKMGMATRAAIRQYQTGRGAPTDVLTLRSAKELGLIAYSREELLAAG